MNLSLRSKSQERPLPPGITERRDRTYAHMQRIERALEDAGFDPQMLNHLPPGHIFAALLLNVK
jgi:hypothetical protein